MLTVYGRASSRGSRCLWALEELGIPYNHIPIDYEKGQNRDPAFLSINEAGKIPAMVDGTLTMTESLAITLYIAKTYGSGKIWPIKEPEQWHCIQWAFWAATEFEPMASDLLDEVLFRPKDAQPRTDIIEKARSKVNGSLTTLESALQGRSYLVGETFTVADICVASIVKWLNGVKHPLPPNVGTWLALMLARPANQRVLSIKKAVV